MSKILFFLITSTLILVLTSISISLAPIINNISNLNDYSPKDLDCELFSDQRELSKSNLDLFQRLKTFKNLCSRQKAMHNLEYTSLIINAVLSFLCTNFALLHYFKEADNHQKKTGIFGLICGFICFILTLIYICFSGYIFTNDVAFGNIFYNQLSQEPQLDDGIYKLFSNGAKYKYNGNRYITSYEESTELNSQFLKYKELGNRQYNYDKDIYIKYMKNYPTSSNSVNQCNIRNSYTLSNYNNKINNCDYLFTEPYSNSRNKYLYDRWLTTLILAVIISILDLVLAVCGLVVFLDKDTPNLITSELVVYGNK